MSLRKAIYIILGCIGLILGAVGVIVPMLPAFPFLLLQRSVLPAAANVCTAGLSARACTKTILKPTCAGKA